MIKNKKVLGLFLILFVAINFLGCEKPKPEKEDEVLDILKNINKYTSDIDITIENSRQTVVLKGKQISKGKDDYVLKLSSGREISYKQGKINVKDSENSKKYRINEEFDNLYKMSFIQEYVKLLYTSEEINFFYKKIAGVNYLVVKLDIPYMCKNLCKSEMYLNYEDKIPYKIIIYDDKGEEKVKILFKNFNTKE
ncbi:germination lipoprotein GerS-related protein [Haloimpatiens sp. FM7315]|uniref:germination lipoprotein GerS-related protein n=1 Tax=Haloimpatiens sp. FM7315 TaxID=3298609 RepID=UPI00370B09BF